MKNKAFIINFDITPSENLDYKKFHETLIKAGGVESWWHYLESSYIVVASLTMDVTAESITKFVMEALPNKRFFVCELNLSNHNGYLPKEAWDWINRYK